jgi:hypothetical protein
MPVPAVHLIFFGFDLARVKVKVCTKIFLVDCILGAFLARVWTLFQGVVKACTKIVLVDCISRAFLARVWTLFQDMHISI